MRSGYYDSTQLAGQRKTTSALPPEEQAAVYRQLKVSERDMLDSIHRVAGTTDED